jgi:hypothetical protein
MLMTGADHVDAEQAFTRMTRARRFAALLRALRREPRADGRLAVFERPETSRSSVAGVREIPLREIAGTLEPARASLFDRSFRPAPAARPRWQRVWLAEHRGAPLPPISVVSVGDAYAVVDGHHRVSVARARGAYAIDACIAG